MAENDMEIRDICDESYPESNLAWLKLPFIGQTCIVSLTSSTCLPFFPSPKVSIPKAFSNVYILYTELSCMFCFRKLLQQETIRFLLVIMDQSNSPVHRL